MSKKPTKEPIPDDRTYEEKYPQAFYYLNFQDYIGKLLKGTSQKLIFDYLVTMADEFLYKKGQPFFYHSFKVLSDRTGVSESTCKRTIKKFEKELGIIHTWVGEEEQKHSTIFFLDYERIIELLPSLVRRTTGRGTKTTILPRYEQRLRYFEAINKLQAKAIRKL
ncbi:winged helix-turn-helix domain-containing protein [Pontibacter litorisediminis]|uniref:winged helix-turn-helix domain-containing protein n=1 Tax=Pontibacter litorisediminis TaxID=1846260 RepID=UPI0023EBBFD3|nr:winged helix-turn-helix domain-containing protein [Pontibacter litorisediminis]